MEILPTAWEDLKKIEDCYMIQLDVQTAFKVSDHILEVIERMEDFPYSGSFIPDNWLNVQGHRSFSWAVFDRKFVEKAHGRRFYRAARARKKYILHQN